MCVICLTMERARARLGLPADGLQRSGQCASAAGETRRADAGGTSRPAPAEGPRRDADLRGERRLVARPAPELIAQLVE
ncbi:hypothetical protein SAMN05216552_102540 [Pseudoduganella namucuonensis]|uniref:Uncharacterized protein n=1 Tax=Pseudoduganella namucuonensis TaxID=1035707 RepID=A0A1I7L9L4_9BURK|nr:hypothetical protein SAMN05216552_102540 [Pseudoduganella namucuonensis]